MRKGYYIICVNPYEIDGTNYHMDQIQWKSKECRPIVNTDWRKATVEEISAYRVKHGLSPK